MAEPASDSIAILPGSYDPLTLGHVDVIRRAAPLFEHLIVGVLDNPDKQSLFSAEQRVALIDAELADSAGVKTVAFSGLAIDFAARQGARWIVRGIRSATDAAYELPMVHTNRACGGVETILVPARPELAFVSSTLARQIGAGGGDLSALVPPRVAEALRSKLSSR